MIERIKKNLTIPNAMTAFRIVLIVPLVRFLLKENYIAAGVILLLSALSDMFDGMIARKFHQVTNLGKLLDPIADKLTLMAVAVCVNVIYPEIRMFTFALLTKEILMLCGGALLLKLHIRPPAARWWGKTATVVFYTSIITLVLLKAIWNYTNATLTVALFALTTAFMMFSLVMYVFLFAELIRKRSHNEKTD